MHTNIVNLTSVFAYPDKIAAKTTTGLLLETEHHNTHKQEDDK